MPSDIARDAQSVVGGSLTFNDGQIAIAESLAGIDADWKAYLASDIRPEVFDIIPHRSACFGGSKDLSPCVDKSSVVVHSSLTR